MPFGSTPPVLLVVSWFLSVLLVVVVHVSSSWVPLPTMDEWKTWTLEELERQMSPSQWNPHNLTSVQVVEKYIQSGLNGTELSRKSLAHSLDLPYGEGPAQKLDFYGTDLPMHSPIFFWIHGGYWQEGSKEMSGHFATVLHSWGFKSVVMGYTLAPAAGIQDMEAELGAALKLVSDVYPFSKLVIGGHSAGGQLVSSLLSSSKNSFPGLFKQVVGLYFVSGVFDLRPLVPTTVNRPLKLTPESAEGLSALFKDVSPAWQSVPVKCLIVVGFYDSPEFQRQSTGFYEMLKSQVESEFWVSQFDDHFSIVEELAVETSESSQRLHAFLKPFHNVASGGGAGGEGGGGGESSASLVRVNLLSLGRVRSGSLWLLPVIFLLISPLLLF